MICFHWPRQEKHLIGLGNIMGTVIIFWTQMETWRKNDLDIMGVFLFMSWFML